MTRYEVLAQLAEHELELVSTGDVERLSEIHEAREALVAALPAMPPPAARPALERAAELQARVTKALDARVRSTAAELGKLTRGRTAMAGYAPSVERVKLVDRAG